jgi:replicative DNA helicase
MKTRSDAKKARDREHEERSKTREYTIDVPNDPINEQVVLAAMIVDDEVRSRLIKKFPADAFYAEEHRAIAAGLAELERRKLTYDPATLVRIAPDVDIRRLEHLADARPEVPQNLDFHVDTLSWDWQRAQLTKGPLAALLEAVQNPKEQPERVKALCRQIGTAIEGEHGRARYLRNPKEVVRQAMETIRRRSEGEAHYPYGIPTLDYFEQGVLDAKGRDIGGTRRIKPGAAPGTINMVTAVSGSGKSTFMGHLALGLGRQRRRLLFGAWEEEAPVTLEFLAILSLGWSRSRMLDGKSNRLNEDGDGYEPLTHEELVAFEERMDQISKYILFFDNPFQRNRKTTGRRQTNDDHLDVIQDHLEESGAEIFFADLWQRCLIDTAPDDERHALFRQLAIANEQRCHVVMAHQQRAKDIESRPDKRPTREGIIGSGAWLDVCWTVMAPHLPAKWKPVPDNTLELYILKQRNGAWPLCIEFDWDSDFGSIANGRSVAINPKGDEDDGGAFPKPERRGKRR